MNRSLLFTAITAWDYFVAWQYAASQSADVGG